MKKFAKLTAFATITVLLVTAVAFAQSAGPDKSRFVGSATSKEAPLTAATVIKKTYLNSGAPFLSVPAGTFTVLDPGTTINCPGASNCTLVVDAWATSANAAGGDRALCTVVDNTIVGFCAYAGNDSTTGEFSAFASLDGNITIGPGNHSAFIYVFSNGGTTVAFYSTRYRVYKP
jgi:hypothetical protein